METLDHHHQIHNDIKPQNYLVKFTKGENDLSQIEIVLTDFGLAGSDNKGGTPVFASPECLANPDRKNKSTDIFSLGRVYLFMILPKKEFLEFLFVSLIKGGKEKIMKFIDEDPSLKLISKMMGIKERISLPNIRDGLHKDVRLRRIDQIRNWDTINDISKTIENSSSEFTRQYMDNLEHLS